MGQETRSIERRRLGVGGLGSIYTLSVLHILNVDRCLVWIASCVMYPLNDFVYRLPTVPVNLYLNL